MKLKQIDPPALYQLLGYLAAVSDFIRTGELKWYFDIKLFEYEEIAPDIRDFIGTAFPDSKPALAEITEASVQDLAETFKHEFGRSLDPDVSLKLLTGDAGVRPFTTAANRRKSPDNAKSRLLAILLSEM